MKFWYFLLVLVPFPGYGQFTLSGHVNDEDSREGLIGVTIQDVNSGKGTVTNVFGFYSLTIDSDSLLLRISYVGYNTLKECWQIPRSCLSWWLSRQHCYSCHLRQPRRCWSPGSPHSERGCLARPRCRCW